MGDDEAVLLLELALGHLYERGAIAEGQQLAFVDDADVVVAALRRDVHPFGEVEIAFGRRWLEDVQTDGRDCRRQQSGIWLSNRAHSPDAEGRAVRPTMSLEVERLESKPWLGLADDVPVAARTEPSPEGRQHQLIGVERLRDERHPVLQLESRAGDRR